MFNSIKSKYHIIKNNAIRIITAHSRTIDNLLRNSIFYFVAVLVAFHVYYFYIFFIDKSVSSTELFILTAMDIGIKVFLCVYLMFRFHPYRIHQLNRNDTMIIFFCSFFLLWTIAVDAFFFKVPSVITPANSQTVIRDAPDMIFQTFSDPAKNTNYSKYYPEVLKQHTHSGGEAATKESPPIASVIKT